MACLQVPYLLLLSLLSVKVVASSWQADATLPLATVGNNTINAISKTEILVGTHTIVPGGGIITDARTRVSLESSVLYVDGSKKTLPSEIRFTYEKSSLSILSSSTLLSRRTSLPKNTMNLTCSAKIPSGRSKATKSPTITTTHVPTDHLSNKSSLPSSSVPTRLPLNASQITRSSIDPTVNSRRVTSAQRISSSRNMHTSRFFPPSKSSITPMSSANVTPSGKLIQAAVSTNVSRNATNSTSMTITPSTKLSSAPKTITSVSGFTASTTHNSMLTTNTVLRTTISTSGGSFATDIPVLGGAAAAAIGAAAGAAVLLYGLPEEAAVFALPEVAEAFEVGADGIPELENAKDQPDGEPDDDNDDNDNQSNAQNSGIPTPSLSEKIKISSTELGISSSSLMITSVYSKSTLESPTSKSNYTTVLSTTKSNHTVASSTSSGNVSCASTLSFYNPFAAVSLSSDDQDDYEKVRKRGAERTPTVASSFSQISTGPINTSAMKTKPPVSNINRCAIKPAATIPSYPGKNAVSLNPSNAKSAYYVASPSDTIPSLTSVVIDSSATPTDMSVEHVFEINIIAAFLTQMLTGTGRRRLLLCEQLNQPIVPGADRTVAQFIYDHSPGLTFGGLLLMQSALNKAKGPILQTGGGRPFVGVATKTTEDKINALIYFAICWDLMQTKEMSDLFVAANERIHGVFLAVDSALASASANCQPSTTSTGRQRYQAPTNLANAYKSWVSTSLFSSNLVTISSNVETMRSKAMQSITQAPHPTGGALDCSELARKYSLCVSRGYAESSFWTLSYPFRWATAPVPLPTPTGLSQKRANDNVCEVNSTSLVPNTTSSTPSTLSTSIIALTNQTVFKPISKSLPSKSPALSDTTTSAPVTNTSSSSSTQPIPSFSIPSVTTTSSSPSPTTPDDLKPILVNSSIPAIPPSNCDGDPTCTNLHDSIAQACLTALGRYPLDATYTDYTSLTWANNTGPTGSSTQFSTPGCAAMFNCSGAAFPSPPVNGSMIRSQLSNLTLANCDGYCGTKWFMSAGKVCSVQLNVCDGCIDWVNGSIASIWGESADGDGLKARRGWI